MKKNTKAIIAIVILVLIVIGAYIGYSKYQTNQKATLAKAQDIKYEVLDESVIQTEILKRWVDENQKQGKGVYNTNDDKFTYILISGGKQDTTGYGINLKKLNGELKQIIVDYSVIKPINNSNIETKESYPHMIIRLPKDSRDIKGNLIEEDKN